MPYDLKDPRSQLASTGEEARPRGASLPAQYFEFARMDPDEVAARGTKTWYVRSQSCCLAFSLAQAGDRLGRDDQPDEYVLLLPSADASAVVTAGDDRWQVDGAAVVIVPPGKSEVAVEVSGTVVRLFSTQATDLADRCRNAEVYREPDPNVAPYVAWPDPPAGHQIRVYPLAAIEPEEGRFGRLLRCSTIMVNYFYPDDGPRDTKAMSPHHHDDFEQISLQLEGDYIHHIRTPWTVDMASWRDDDHQMCSSPAAVIIPPPTVHTSQTIHHMRHQLVDIFCPPRLDFSARPGWVLNSAEYPQP